MNRQEVSQTRAVTLAGLAIALLLPFLTYAGGQWAFGSEQSDERVAAGLVVHWLTFAAIVALVLYAERLPLSSIGVRPFRWWTIPAGVLAGVVMTIATGVLVRILRLEPDVEYAAYLQSLPFITRVLLVITAGVFEETVYRGYALERLASIFGNRWLAALVTVTLFTLAHAPAVGFAHLLPIAIVSVFVTLLYLWRRDLILNMVTHTSIDAIGLLLAPLLSTR
jgi:membrane protease YdiL (CAAX protease family)